MLPFLSHSVRAQQQLPLNNHWKQLTTLAGWTTNQLKILLRYLQMLFLHTQLI